MKQRLATALIIAISATAFTFAQHPVAPVKGTLIISGGDLFPAALERFVTLAGGPDANFVYIPTGASSLRLDSGFIYDPPDSDTPAANTAAFEGELAKAFWREAREGVAHA